LSQVTSEEKTEALLFLALSNIFCTAMELGCRVDLRKMVLSLSDRFVFKGLFVFANSRVNNGLVEALYNIGFTVFSIPYDCDALMGFKISELMGSCKVKAVIIGTHDGDFRGIGDELEQQDIEVYFLGFQNKFSTFLKPKARLYIDRSGSDNA